MNLAGHNIGVCDWSMRTGDLGQSLEMIRAAGVGHVQVALSPLVFLDDKRKHQQLGALRHSGMAVTAGMLGFPGEDYSSIESIRRTGGFVPDEVWPMRKRILITGAELAAELGITKVSTHVGFIPPPGSDGYRRIVDRVGETGAVFASLGIELLMETGQEAADDLRQFIQDLPLYDGRPAAMVNFDPANVILYGRGDPIAAVKALGPFIRHVHVKDAVASDRPGETWGREVPFGQGQVNAAAFLRALHGVDYAGPLVIERETGADPVADIRIAVEALRAASAETNRRD